MTPDDSPSSIRIPATLHAQSRVGIMSPSGPVLSTHLEAGLELLRAWRLEPVVAPQTYARSKKRGYLAGDDALRLAALQHALDDPTLDAIMFARGGYGAMRLLEHLDPRGLIAHPKMLIGFSDITALLMWCVHRAHTMCLHAPVIKSLVRMPSDAMREGSAQALHDALFDSPLRPVHALTLHTPPQAHRATGRVIAGNLSLIQAMLGTPYLPSLAGCVLILEDVTEQDYRLDRLLTSLRLRTLDAPPAAIVLGEFQACGGVYIDDAGIDDFLVELALEFGVPVASGYPTGHGAINHPIPVGAWGTLDSTGGTLYFHAQETP